MDRYQGIISFLNQEEAVNKGLSKKEEKLRAWSKPPSQTEIEKCERAERMIKQAIDEDPKLSKMDISVYAKGSYANRTNIPSDSDVDVAVVAKNYFFNTYPDGMTAGDFGFVDSTYKFEDFKNDVANAVKNKFGSPEVTVGDKCIKVHSNSCRVDADVVPHFVHKRYYANRGNYEGVAILKADGNKIYNWPQQDYDNGVSKNEKTNKRYKAMVRILKSIKSEMLAAGSATAGNAPSYLLACLVYNLPDYFFANDTYEKMATDVINYLAERTSDLANVSSWVEVNELKYLFHTSQPWKSDKVNDFLIEAKKFLAEL